MRNKKEAIVRGVSKRSLRQKSFIFKSFGFNSIVKIRDGIDYEMVNIVRIQFRRIFFRQITVQNVLLAGNFPMYEKVLVIIYNFKYKVFVKMLI